MYDNPTPDQQNLQAIADHIAKRAREALKSRGFTDQQIDDAMAGTKALPVTKLED